MKAVILFFSLIYLFSACNKCHDPTDLSALVFTVYENSANVFDNTFPIYNLDTFYVMDEQNRILDDEYFAKTRDGFALYYFEGDDGKSFSQEICRTYYLYYHVNEIDTMNICFMGETAPCDETAFRYVDVSYNNELQLEGGKGNYVPIKIQKYP